MAELVDATDLKSVGFLKSRAGSSPALPMMVLLNIVMKIAKEGLLIASISLFGIILSIYYIKYSKLYIILLTIFSIFFLFSLYFFRDPQRNFQFKDNEIASPADGTVLSVGSEGDKNIIVVRIFLSIFNVHLQRAPISGKIKKITFTPGKFHIAHKPEAKDNQRNLIEIESENGRWAFVEQITGAIARRIVTYVKENEKIEKGQKIGMIYFGSQVALYLPSNVEILVKPKDKVEAGKTVIGIWKN